MKFRLSMMAMLLAIASALLIAPFSAAAAPQAAPTTGNALTTPVTGTAPNGGVFNGTFTPTGFVNQGGQLNVVGTVTGTLTNSLGQVLATVTNQAVTAPVTGAQGSCTILTLNIGAINLNLLGLVVQLSPINLNITAQQGPGNLLGNLLCAVANLLNGGGPLGNLAGLLNNILRNL